MATTSSSRRAHVLLECAAYPIISLVALLVSSLAISADQRALPRISVESAMLTVKYPDDSVIGTITVTDPTIPLTGLKFQARPLKSGDNRAEVHFLDNGGSDYLWLDSACPRYQTERSCTIQYKITGLDAGGNYEGAIEIYSGIEKVGSIALAVARRDPAFKPIITSELLKNGRIEFDATAVSYFVLLLENPVGAPWRTFKLSDCSSEQITDCVLYAPTDALKPTRATDAPEILDWVARLFRKQSPYPVQQNSAPLAPISYTPHEFTLGPGQSQTIIAQLHGDAPTQFAARLLRITDAKDPGLNSTLLVLARKMPTQASRAAVLFVIVTFGALLSVGLNVIFPFARDKADAKRSLRTLSGALTDCTATGAAVRDAFSSEIGRNRLILDALSFHSVYKDSTMQDVRQAVSRLAPLIGLARDVSNLRFQINSGTLPTRLKLLLETLLCQAEDALIAFDPPGASAKLTEAVRLQAADEINLRTQLTEEIGRLLRKIEMPQVAGHPDAQVQAPPAAADPVAPQVAPQVAHLPKPREIDRLIETLRRSADSIGSIGSAELLQLEQDFYVVSSWINFVAPALDRDSPRFAAFADQLLECLLRNPSSTHVQIMLSLMRSSMTPEEIRAALTLESTSMECNIRPKYLDLIDFQFVFHDPCIAAVPAARRLLSYDWEFGDNTAKPEDFERCRHYFPLPPAHWFKQSGISNERKVILHVSLFGRPVLTLERIIHLQPRRMRASELGAIQIFGFALSTFVAVVTAFSVQYAGPLPDVLDWRTCLSAFLFGIAFDQIRDKAALSSGNSPTSTSTLAASSAAAHTEPPKATTTPAKPS